MSDSRVTLTGDKMNGRLIAIAEECEVMMDTREARALVADLVQYGLGGLGVVSDKDGVLRDVLESAMAAGFAFARNITS